MAALLYATPTVVSLPPSQSDRNDLEKTASRSTSTSQHEGYSESALKPEKLEAQEPSEEDAEAIKTPQTLRKDRFQQLAIFLTLESLWLGLGLIAYFRVIRTPFDKLTDSSGFFSTAVAVLFDSGFGTIANFWQTISGICVVDFAQEVYSGEWWALLQRNKRHPKDAASQLEIDRVSVLTAGRLTQANHAFREHSTFRYRAAFVVVVLGVALHSVAPNAIGISNHLVITSRTLLIGALIPNLTQLSDDTTLSGSNNFSSQRAQISQTTKTDLSQKVVRFEYLTQIEHSLPDFAIVNASDATLAPDNNILFGMPPRQILNGEEDAYRYHSDAVWYNFSCQWLAPELADDFSSGPAWSFGGDMKGVFDFEAYVNPPYLAWSFGIYPLNIVSGAGATDGSLAWFIFGLTSQSDLGQLDTSIDLGISFDLSQVPVSQKNIGFNNWTAVVAQTDDSADKLVSTSASVLFCDPRMHIGSVLVEARSSGLLYYNSLNTPLVGNLDSNETSRMLGRGLNGIPWDSVVIISEDRLSLLSQLAAELLFKPPQIDESRSSTYSVYTPQDLTNISAALNNYTSISGMSAFLDGSVGNMTVKNATAYTTEEALVISTPAWFTSLFLVLIMAILIVVVTVRDSIKKEELVPFTLETVKQRLAQLH